MSFVHLHVHTEYSLLDGLSRTKDLAAEAKRLDMPAVAITDHGAMYGVVPFYNDIKDAGLKPIIGCEVYMSPRGMNERDHSQDRSSYHLTLLAMNATGYQNLLAIASAAQLQGFYYKPRIDKNFLAEHNEGVIVLSGCGSGEIASLCAQAREEQGLEVARWYREVFGDRFYVELQYHEGLPELVQINRKLADIAQELGLPLVATNDVHYVRREDSTVQDVLLCIQTGTTVNDANRLKMSDDSYYLKSLDEMALMFGDYPEALSNTLAIAERCNFSFGSRQYHLPRFPVPEEQTAEQYLRTLCQEGIEKKYSPVTETVQKRLDYELGIIHQMGFDDYFLIVWDLIQHARSVNIWWNVRGSGAGSLVAHALGITRLDPLEHKLMFERFLNPGRISMPDIDLDLPDDRREEMIAYCTSKYGQDKVAQIISFGTMGARGSIRDAGRALDLPLQEVDRITRLVPFGPKVTISDSLENVIELKQQYEGSDYVKHLIDTAKALEGISRHASTHAAGLVISDKPLVQYAPLHRATRGEGAITQYDMGVVEKIGLLKIDFLGLSTLTVMKRAADLIAERHGVRYDLNTIPLDDPKAFELLSSGEVTGLFQVESPGMRRVLRDLLPQNINDITAVIALYRPGPMQFIDEFIACRRGQKQPEYVHPVLEPILSDTFGVCVYQEQIIRILTDLAGYDAGEADQVRRAVSKKKQAELLKHRGIFVEGSMRNSGISHEAADKIFDAFEYFANYGFNRAHAADYAAIVCQTAFLKANYPLEYMSASLTTESGNAEKVAGLIAECRQINIPVLGPDVNHSEMGFTIEGDAIRFGLAGIKNVGEGPVQILLSARQEGGPFQSLDDFANRVDMRQVNKRVLESLIKAGALDCFGDRNSLLGLIDSLVAVSQQTHLSRESGQMSMFGSAAAGPAFSGLQLSCAEAEEPKSLRERLGWEKDLLGIYVSEHPLRKWEQRLGEIVTAYSDEIKEEMAGQQATVAGLVQSVRSTMTRKGDKMAFVRLEDIRGTIEVVVFPRTYRETEAMWQTDKIVIVKGKVDYRGDSANIICESVIDQLTTASVAASAMPEAQKRRLLVAWQRTGDLKKDCDILRQVYKNACDYPGQDDLAILVREKGRTVRIDFPSGCTRISEEIKARMWELVGQENCWVETAASIH